jgi:dihydrofolate reductase
MRKVVLYTLLSLDGVAEAPNAFMFAFDDEMNDNLAEVIGSQDTVLLGRRMYDEWARFWPSSDIAPFADFINGVDKRVATSTPLSSSWANATAIEGPVPEAVRALRQEPGADIGIHGSIDLSQSLFRGGLVDEIRLVVAPTVAGAGRRLFDGADDLRRLELLESRSTTSGSVLLAYRVLNT